MASALVTKGDHKIILGLLLKFTFTAYTTKIVNFIKQTYKEEKLTKSVWKFNLQSFLLPSLYSSISSTHAHGLWRSQIIYVRWKETHTHTDMKLDNDRRCVFHSSPNECVNLNNSMHALRITVFLEFKDWLLCLDGFFNPKSQKWGRESWCMEAPSVSWIELNLAKMVKVTVFLLASRREWNSRSSQHKNMKFHSSAL